LKSGALLAENISAKFQILLTNFYFYAMHKASVNDKDFEIDNDGDQLTVNGKPFHWDIIKIADGYFHILHNNKSYRAEIVRTDNTTKTFTFKINGRIYSVSVKDKFDILLDKLGINASATHKINTIKAPMPGLIIDLRIRVGDKVKAGDALLILEAMKMENIIKSPGDGLVRSVKIQKGDSVEKGQILVEF
jgi:biotin carboxyl carrier protein